MAKTYKSGKRRQFTRGERARNLRDTIAMLEASRRSYSRQLAGEIPTLFSEAWLRHRIGEIETAQQGHRKTIACL